MKLGKGLYEYVRSECPLYVFGMAESDTLCEVQPGQLVMVLDQLNEGPEYRVLAPNGLVGVVVASWAEEFLREVKG